MKVQVLLLSVVAALVSTTFATHNAPHRQRRNAAAPETVEAQRIRRAQYVHPAGAAKRAALYESDKPLELEKRTFGNWWWHWGGSDDGHHNPPPCPTQPTTKPSPIPPKPCQQGQWQPCGSSTQCYNGWTIGSYKSNDDHKKCCKDGLVCKNFGHWGQGYCIKEHDWNWCDTAVKNHNSQQQIQDFFNKLLNGWGH